MQTERVEANENYDDIVDETQVPERTSLGPSYTPEAVTSTTVVFVESKAGASTVAPSAGENAEGKCRKCLKPTVVSVN